MNGYSSFLYSQPSFLEGFGRVIDLGDTMTVYNSSSSGEMADYLATLSDWCAVGEDLKSAITQFADGHPLTKKSVRE